MSRLHKCYASLCNSLKRPQRGVCASVWLVYRVMKCPTTTQRTTWVLYICFPSILAPENTQVTLRWGSNMVSLLSALSLLSSLSPSCLPSSPPFSFSYSPQWYLVFSLIASTFYCSPSLFCRLSRLFFSCSFLSIFPPPTLSGEEVSAMFLL